MVLPTSSYVRSWIPATGSQAFGYAVIPMLFIFYFHYDIALTPLLYSYPTELFPYEWRSWGVAYTLICTNASQIIGMFANPLAMGTLGWRYYIIFCVLDALFTAAVWLLFPETKGKSLEELADLFEKRPVTSYDVDDEKHQCDQNKSGFEKNHIEKE